MTAEDTGRTPETSGRNSEISPAQAERILYPEGEDAELSDTYFDERQKEKKRKEAKEDKKKKNRQRRNKGTEAFRKAQGKEQGEQREPSGRQQTSEADVEIPIPKNVRQAAAAELRRLNTDGQIWIAQRLGDNERSQAAVLTDLSRNIIERAEADARLAPLKAAEDDLRRTESQIALETTMRNYVDVIAAQNPEALRIPTKERAEIELRRPERDDRLEEDEALTDERYEDYVLEWFNERFKHLEKSDNQTFEEQQMLVAPIVLAYTQLELEKDTESLGEKMREAYETRRNLHRQSIIWRLNVMENIFQGSAGMDTKYFKEIFTTATAVKVIDDDGNITREKRYLIAEKFRNFEAMGEELVRLREIANDKRLRGSAKTAAKTRVAEYQKEIMDYYLEGGYVRNEDGSIKFDSEDKPITYTKEISRLRKLLKSDNLTDIERKKFEVSLESKDQERWAYKMAGRLFSITGRAGSFDIIMNNLGDVFSTRLQNINTKLGSDARHDYTKMIWDTEINGRKMDVGAFDFWKAIIERVQYKADEATRRHKKGDIKYDTLRRMGITADNLDTEKFPQRDGRKQEKIYKITSLKNAKLEDPAFWDELFNNRGVSSGEYGGWIDKHNRADQTRKYIFGYGKFLNSPSMENYLKLGEVYDNYSGEAYGSRGGERFSEQQREWAEVLQRTLEWGRTVAVKDKESDWAVFPETEAYNWIEGAYNAGMISGYHRENLHAEFVGYKLLKPLNKSRASKVLRRVPIVGSVFDPVKVGGFKRRIGIMVAPFRDPTMRRYIISSSLWETLKRMLGYVFVDEF